MAAGVYDLYIEQGADFQLQCTYKDETGAPVNLTGMTLNAQIRATYSDQNTIAIFNVVIANQTNPALLGQFSISLDAATTASIPVNMASDFELTNTTYAWDIFLDTGASVRKLMQGEVFISPEVTR